MQTADPGGNPDVQSLDRPPEDLDFGGSTRFRFPGGAVAAALELSRQVENAVIVVIICDRGDRYLSTGVFPV